MSEVLAIIEEVGVGQRDAGRPILWFNVTGDGWGSLQIFDLKSEEALSILGSVYDVRDLDGRACIVSRDDGKVHFVRLLQPARKLKR